MSIQEKNRAVVLKIFDAIETRDPRHPNPQSVAELFHPDVEFQWPASLPYGGTSRGMKTDGPTWLDTWSPLQPTEAERKMEPRVVAVSDEEVVVLWRQSWAVSCSTVLTPCLRLFTSVELIDAGRLSTALCSPVAALAAAPHCLAASAEETWSSWPFRLLA